MRSAGLKTGPRLPLPGYFLWAMAFAYIFNLILPEFENIARLAIEHLTNGFECFEANGLCLAGFQDRQVRQGNAYPFTEFS
ncbi:hypothetical protein D9M68_879230 [compost metagenome]